MGYIGGQLEIFQYRIIMCPLFYQELEVLQLNEHKKQYAKMIFQVRIITNKILVYNSVGSFKARAKKGTCHGGSLFHFIDP